MNCKINLIEDNLSNEIKIAILKKAAKLQRNSLDNTKKKNKRTFLRR
jgi:hypothetical protein